VSKKTWIIFAVICVVVLGGLIVLSQKDKVDVSSVDQSKLQTASPANGNIADHVTDLPNSKVQLIEYGDFQCPYCGQAYPAVKKITTDYASKITFVFRNYPLSTLHPNAKAGAAAAEAAGLQGKYWEMHDKLYESQDEWSSLSTDDRTNKFTEYAKDIGVKDLNKFKTDMASDNVNKKIDFDLALGNKFGVTGTPTFELNGQKVSDDVASSVISTGGDGAAMRTAIDNLLK
jgi:protein-disulfide isomerase